MTTPHEATSFCARACTGSDVSTMNRSTTVVPLIDYPGDGQEILGQAIQSMLHIICTSSSSFCFRA